jgi:hypothetical protein
MRSSHKDMYMDTKNTYKSMHIYNYEHAFLYTCMNTIDGLAYGQYIAYIQGSV